MFSGGIDSTYLLYKNLKEGNDVSFIHNIITNNKNQTKREEKSTENVISWLRNKFPDSSLAEYDFMEFGINFHHDGVFFVQPILWLSSVAIFLQSSPLFDSVEYGLIMNDDGVSYTDDFKKIFDDLLILPCQESMKGKLNFPLIKHSKYEIMSMLPKDLLKLTSSCEGVSADKYCGICHSCRFMKFACGFDNDTDLNLVDSINTEEEIEKYKKRHSDDLVVTETLRYKDEDGTELMESSRGNKNVLSTC